jgi:hypothetical protein
MYARHLEHAATALELLAIRRQADCLAVQHYILACDEPLQSLQLSVDDAVAVYTQPPLVQQTLGLTSWAGHYTRCSWSWAVR